MRALPGFIIDPQVWSRMFECVLLAEITAQSIAWPIVGIGGVLVFGGVASAWWMLRSVRRRTADDELALEQHLSAQKSNAEPEAP